VPALSKAVAEYLRECSRVDAEGRLLIRMKTGGALYVRLPKDAITALKRIPVESKYRRTRLPVTGCGPSTQTGHEQSVHSMRRGRSGHDFRWRRLELERHAERLSRPARNGYLLEQGIRYDRGLLRASLRKP